jgi:hypothetical protein
MERPLSIFIASASEGLDVANAVRDVLRGNIGFEPRVWNESTFKPSMAFIEALEVELDQSDFAVVTLTPDDKSETRGQAHMAPRDNVLFELGLFMGRLGRERTYFVCEKNNELKIPTDLLGVSPASYERRDGQDLAEAVSMACSVMAKRMRDLDVRLKLTPEAETEKRLVSNFCERITGSWWGRQWSSQGDERLSLFRIVGDHGANTVRVDGETFDAKGQLYGKWKTVAIGIRLRERTMFFCWEGTHPTTLAGEIFGGFGQYTFEDTPGMLNRGDGLFADIQMTRKKVARWTSVELRRVDKADLDGIAETMKKGSDSTRASEVMKALNSFRGGTGLSEPNPA